MPIKVRDEIIYLFPNFNGCTVEVWEWISNFIPPFITFIMNVINHPLDHNMPLSVYFRCMMWPWLLAQFFTRATCLDLSDRNLTTIPQNIPMEDTKLTLSGNELVSLRQNEFILLSNLIKLNLRNNKIATIADGAFNGLTTLENLDLSYNCITDIPDLSGLVSLESLNLNHNSRIQVVNSTKFTDLKKLKLLSLSYIGIYNIMPFPNLPKLVTIFLVGNNFTHISPYLLEAYTSLRYIHLKQNKLNHLPDLGGLNKTIKRLSLKENRIYYFPDVSSFHDLESLYLDDNYIVAIASDVALPMKLLGLNGNPISCATELCWLAQRDEPTVELTCQDGMPWSGMTRQILCEGAYILTHWGRGKIAAISQTTFSNVFSWIKTNEFRLRFHWNLFLGFELTIFQHWFR